MVNQITHGEVVLLCSLGVVLVLFLGLTIIAIIRDRPKKEKDTHEPYAGKTLGL